MKSVKKILLSLLFLSACSSSMVFAEERADTVNVVVPSSINMVFNADGTNTVSEFGVTNNSQLPLTINNIGVTAKNNWDLVSSSTSISKNKRLLNMNINGVELVKGNNSMSIGITEGTKKVIPVSIKRGLWTTNINESAFNLQVDYSFGVKKFTLSFNTDGGTNVNPISANNGSNVVLPTSRKNGKTLEGWIDSSGTLYKPGSNYTMPVGGGTLTAKWRDNKYTVKFDGNGATLGTMSDLDCTYGIRDKLPLNAYVKTGHTFVNWTVRKVVAGETYWLYRNSSDISWFKEGTEPSGYIKHVYEDGKDTISPTDVDGDVITLVAQWSVNSYYLDLGGMLDGSSSMNTNGYGTFDVYIEGVLKAQGVSDYYTLHPYGTNYEVKNIKATTGHTYGGVHSGTLKGSIGEGHRSVRLIFNTNTYSVVYNANGGTGSSSTSTHKYGVEKALSTNGFSRVGYTFEGWNTKPDGSGTNYSNNQLVTNLTSVDKATVTLYAKWKPISYTIGYTLNGGVVSGNPSSYNIETETFTLKNPTKTGNTFLGWTGSNGSTAQKSVSIIKGTTGNKAYTANWSVNSYTLTYNANGGSVSSTSKQVQYGSQYGTLPTPTRTGYTFKGWYTSASGGTKVASTNVMGASNVTIYAQWTPITYSITYNLNGGSNPSGVATSYNIETNTFNLPTPTKNGYSFGGWYSNSSFTGSVITSITKGSTGNKVLYAKWTSVNYSISYNLNGGTVSGNPSSYNIETETFTLKNPTKTGYTFIGWTGSNGSTSQTSVSIAKGSTGNKSYTANWKANSYTYNIKYVSSSGKSLGTSTVSGEFGSSKSVSAPAKAGYTTPNAQTVNFDSTSTKTITFTYPLVNYTISYNLNGGSMPIKQDYYSFPGYESMEYNIFTTTYYGVDLTNAISISTDYLGGMSYSFQLTINDEYSEYNTSISSIPEQYKVPNSKVSFSWSVRDGAMFQPGMTVTRYSNNPVSYNVETPSFTLTNPTKSGSTFSGWTGSNGTSAQNSVSIPTGSTGNKTFTANWKSNDPVVPSVSRVMYGEKSDPNIPKHVYLSGQVGASASVSDGGTLSYEWDLYYFALGYPSGGGPRQPVACKVTGLPTNTGLVDVTKIATFYNSDEWMMGSEVDPFQYGDSLHNAIGGYLTVKNTLGGKTVSTKVWVGDNNQTYKNMYASAPRGSNITFGKALSSDDMTILENNEEICNTQQKEELDMEVIEDITTVESPVKSEEDVMVEEDSNIEVTPTEEIESVSEDKPPIIKEDN